MTAFVKYNCFAKDAAEKKHDLSSDAINVSLTSRAPVVATDRVLADISEVAAGNGYTTGGNPATLVSSSQAGGVYTILLNNPTPWVATTGPIGPFRYAVIRNATANLLIGYFDYGSTITCETDEEFALGLSQLGGLFTVT